MTWVFDVQPGLLPLPVHRKMQELQREIAEIRGLILGERTAIDGDTTPSVLGVRVLRTKNTNATTITTFDGGRVNQRVTVLFDDANTTLDHGTDIVLDSGSDFTAADGDVKEFVYDGAAWREIPTG